MGRQRRTGGSDRLAAMIADARRAGRAGAIPRALIIPVLDADPATDDPTNLWAFDDGRIRWRGTDGTVHEIVPLIDQGYRIKSLSSDPAASTGIDFYRNSGTDELRVRRPDGTWAKYPSSNPVATGEGGGTTTGSGTTSQSRGSDTTPATYRTTWFPTWGQMMCPVHGVETGAGLFYGELNSVHGNRQVMLGFDYAAIQAELAGATIDSCELTMTNVDAYGDQVTVYFGGHDAPTQPVAYTSVREQVFSDVWPKAGSGDTWRVDNNGGLAWIAAALRDDVIRGLTISQPVVTALDELGNTIVSPLFYGQMDWTSLGLRITYSK